MARFPDAYFSENSVLPLAIPEYVGTIQWPEYSLFPHRVAMHIALTAWIQIGHHAPMGISYNVIKNMRISLEFTDM